MGTESVPPHLELSLKQLLVGVPIEPTTPSSFRPFHSRSPLDGTGDGPRAVGPASSTLQPLFFLPLCRCTTTTQRRSSTDAVVDAAAPQDSQRWQRSFPCGAAHSSFEAYIG